MITVKELKAELEKFPDNIKCSPYEGEITGVILVDGYVQKGYILFSESSDTIKTVVESEGES